MMPWIAKNKLVDTGEELERAIAPCASATAYGAVRRGRYAMRVPRP